MAQNPDLITAADVASLAGVARQTVNRWAISGKLECITLPSGVRRFRRADVVDLLTPKRAPVPDSGGAVPPHDRRTA